PHVVCSIFLHATAFLTSFRATTDPRSSQIFFKSFASCWVSIRNEQRRTVRCRMVSARERTKACWKCYDRMPTSLETIGKIICRSYFSPTVQLHTVQRASLRLRLCTATNRCYLWT